MTQPRNASSYQGQRHYTWNGEKLPSVTTILQSYPKPWLGAWAAKMVTEFVATDLEPDYEQTLLRWTVLDMAAHEATDYHKKWHQKVCDFQPDPWHFVKGSPWRKRDDAADFGTALHEALAALVAGRKMEVDPGAYGHAAAVEQWWDAYRPLVLDSEVQVFNLQHRYAGSLDLIAEVYGRRLLIDLKSGSVVGHDARLQLAAYRFAQFIGADNQVIAAMPEVDGCAVLWVPRDDPRSWQFIECRAGAAEFAHFLALRQLHDFIQIHKDLGLGELILPQARLEVA